MHRLALASSVAKYRGLSAATTAPSASRAQPNCLRTAIRGEAAVRLSTIAISSTTAASPLAAIAAVTLPRASPGLALIGQPLDDERWRGCGGTGRFPHRDKEGGTWGKQGFPPRERARGERRSRLHLDHVCPVLVGHRLLPRIDDDGRRRLLDDRWPLNK